MSNSQEESNVKVQALEWKNIGHANWFETVQKAEELKDGWRLPTIQELKYASENNINYGACITERYWSATEYEGCSDMAFISSYFTNRAWPEDKSNKTVVFNMAEKFYGVLVREKQ